MTARLLDGKSLAAKIKEDLRAEIQKIQKDLGKVPKVINIMIGDDHSACAYANSQKKTAEQIGINYRIVNFSKDIRQNELIEKIKELNADPEVHGILVHKPVPQQIDYKTVTSYVDIRKDLEGINATNVGRMMIGETKIIPCTPAAVMAHIHSTGVDLKGKEAVVIGHSEIVGKPLALLLLLEEATVTVCHVATSQAGKLEEHIARADILIVAVGKADLIKGGSIREGTIVIDVGINMLGDKMVGDVEFDSVKEKASYITPVPGGVGPVTVVILMKNAIEAFKAQQAQRS